MDKKKLLERLNELREARAEFIRQAELEIARYDGAIGEFERLLEPEGDDEDDEDAEV